MNKISTLKQTIFTITAMVLCLCIQKTQAQSQPDKIFVKDHRVLFVDIKNSRGDTIKYRTLDDKTGTIYAMPKSNIDKVVLKSGGTVNYSNYVEKDSVYAEKSIYPFYVDMSLGLLSISGDGFSYLGPLDINVGYSILKEHSIGLSLIAWNSPSDCCSTSASGVGFQWRYRSSANRLFLKIEGGYVLRAHYGDDGNYRSEYNYQKSSKTYFRTTAALHYGKTTWGFTFVSTKNQINDTFSYDTKQFLRVLPFSVSTLSFGVGIAAPEFRKKRK
jgi:hypothetical protein